MYEGVRKHACLVFVTYKNEKWEIWEGRDRRARMPTPRELVSSNPRPEHSPVSLCALYSDPLAVKVICAPVEARVARLGPDVPPPMRLLVPSTWFEPRPWELPLAEDGAAWADVVDGGFCSISSSPLWFPRDCGAWLSSPDLTSLIISGL